MTDTPAQNKRIMVVEDDFFIRDMLVELLEDEGYTVTSAANGSEALMQLRAGTELPGLILLDLMMPVMDGRQFRQEQQQEVLLQPIPVVVLTASSDSELLPPSFEPAAYVPKPINLKGLLDIVAVFCSQPHCARTTDASSSC